MENELLEDNSTHPSRSASRETQPMSGMLYLRIILIRYLRLSPLLLVVILISWKLGRYLGDGPFFPALGLYPDNCKEHWYLNMLYVQNLFPWGNASLRNMCLGHSWYL